jgi:transposase InsO family protein
MWHPSVLRTFFKEDAMPEQTTAKQRRSFFDQHRSGATYRVIAQAAHVSLECVRHWCRRIAKGGSDTTTYQRQPAGLLRRFPPLVRYVLLRLRLAHPRWGPTRLRYHMGQRPSLHDSDLPCPASIGYYLHQWQRFRRPPRPHSLAKRPNTPTQVHECWQVDFKVGITADDQRLVTMTTIRDVVSGATIGAYLTPVQRVGGKPQALTFPHVRAALRRCFAQWQTLPDRIQTDNEAVFRGKPGENKPSPLTLWLIGLNIPHIPTRPGQPTDNAEVERQQRTINDYAIVGHNNHNRTDQPALDQALHELNYALPSRATGCAGRPPVVAYPALLQPRRFYAPELEASLFDLKRVDAYLATFTWTHTVGKTGQTNLGGYHRPYYIGRHYRGQKLVVRFDPSDRHLVFSDGTGCVVKRCRLRYMEVSDLLGTGPWPDGAAPQPAGLPPDLDKG